MKKVRMVLEGGSFRGLYTAGVLDVLMENNINIDEIVGVSAGALFGVNYFSNQKGRVIRYNKKYCNDKRFMSLKSLILTGNYINKNFAFYEVTKKLDPFDNDSFVKSKKNFYAVVTNIETGKPEYIKIKSPIDDLEVLRATSAIPLASRIIKINNKKYLDGGISDSIPVYFNKDKYKKNIVILTRPIDYKKHPLSKSKERLIKFKFRKYPNLLNTMFNRHNAYNKVLEDIKEMERKKEIFVIRPSKPLDIKLNENNPEKLQEIYDLGVENCKKIIKKLKKYLEE
jgi:predicted patatin/cPLA2 family phospholipase